MTHDGRTYGEVRRQRGRWVRRWGGALTAVGVAVVLASCSSAITPTAPVATTSATPSAAPPTATSSPSPTAEALTVENLEIDAALISDPETLAKTFYGERATAWLNAGGTPENAKAGWAQKTMSMPDYAAQVAAEYDKTFIDALLVPGWESNPTVARWVSIRTAAHKDTLFKHFITSLPDMNPLDLVPYTRGVEVLKLKGSDKNQDGAFDLSVTERDFDNADQNRVGDGNNLSAGDAVAGNTVKSVVTFDIVGGKLKLSSLFLDQPVVE